MNGKTEQVTDRVRSTNEAMTRTRSGNWIYTRGKEAPRGATTNMNLRLDPLLDGVFRDETAHMLNSTQHDTDSYSCKY